MSGDQLQFIDYRKPKLEAGEYVFSAVHRFKGVTASSSGKQTSEQLHVRVEGERVSIGNEHIISRYPPKGEVGDFSDTLPHITLKKGTLPWIRFAFKEGDESVQSGAVEVYEPWLYLLVINEDDIAAGRATDITSTTLGNLNQGAFFPQAQQHSLLKDPSLQGAAHKVEAVCLQKRLVKDLLLNGKNTTAQRSQLAYLAHIRRRWQESTSHAVITMHTNLKAVLDHSALSYTQKKSKLAQASNIDLPSTATQISPVRPGKSWLVQDSVQGDLLLEVMAESDTQMDIRVFTLARESSVLMANRFAKSAQTPNGRGRNIAMLVSLERYLDDVTFTQIQALSDSSLMRFMVLTSWEFDCQDEPINFEQRVQVMDVNALRYPDEAITQLEAFAPKLQSGLVPLLHTMRNNDRSLTWFRGPITPNAVKNWEQIHLTEREMGKDTSSQNDSFVSTDADKLLRYFPEDGMLDASYSAAYELGRLLSLQQPEYLAALRMYKKQLTRHAKLLADDAYRLTQDNDLNLQNAELPFGFILASSAQEKRVGIEQWLLQLGSLAPIPNWYLVPDERLLPPDSIRTGFVDPRWIQALWLGALSIEGRPKITYQLLQQNWQKLQGKLPRSAAFVRSDVLDAYPELWVTFRNLDESQLHLPEGGQVNLKKRVINRSSGVQSAIDLASVKRDVEDDYTDLIELHPAIQPLHRLDLTKTTALFLVEKAFDYLSLALPAESLHYGADVDETKHVYQKDVKFRGATVARVAIPMTNASQGIIDVKGLAATIKAGLNDYLTARIANETHAQTHADLQAYQAQLSQFKSARIGRFMLEGEPQVEFTVGDEK